LKLGKTKFIFLLILVATISRLIPHPPNFTPITAIALFSITKLDNKFLATLIPLLCLYLSDIFLGFFTINIFVYLSFILISLLGYYIRKINLFSVLLSSLLFFIMSNFGVWILGYPKTFEGFFLCYFNAIPFFGYTILGDLFYCYLMKLVYNYFERKNYIKFVS
tara:strand:+ start:186 stop:677 length:492 start_codon:yes stop_codon:yes gene_type:complete